MKLFFITLVVSFSLFAADQYKSFSIAPISRAQSQALLNELDAIDRKGVLLSSSEYIPSTQTFIVNIGGGDISAMVTKIKAATQKILAKNPDTEVVINAGDKLTSKGDLPKKP